MNSSLVVSRMLPVQEAHRVRHEGRILRERAAVLRTQASKVVATSIAAKERALSLTGQSRRLLRRSRAIRRIGCPAAAGGSSRTGTRLGCTLAWRLVAMLAVLAGRVTTSSTVRRPLARPRAPDVTAIADVEPARALAVSRQRKPPSKSRRPSGRPLGGVDGRRCRPATSPGPSSSRPSDPLASRLSRDPDTSCRSFATPRYGACVGRSLSVG